MPMHVTSLRARLRVIAPKQNSFFRNVAAATILYIPGRVVGNFVPNLTGPRFEPQTSHT